MYINLYYLHFPEPVDISAVSRCFAELDDTVEIKPLYPGSFELLTSIPFNRVKHSLDLSFSSAHFYICKVKAGFIHVPD